MLSKFGREGRELVVGEHQLAHVFASEREIIGKLGDMVGSEDEPGNLRWEGAAVNGVVEFVRFKTEHGEGGEVANDRRNFGKVVGEKKEDAEIGEKGKIGREGCEIVMCEVDES